MDVQALVREFHATYNLPAAEPTDMGPLAVSRRELRLGLVSEEFHELLDASAFHFELGDGEPLSPGERVEETDILLTHQEGKLANEVEMADALGDIVYVCFGMAIEMGIDLNEVIAEIHRANMSKLGLDGKPIYREDGKVLKGPNYTPPDIARVLRQQAIDGSK